MSVLFGSTGTACSDRSSDATPAQALPRDARAADVVVAGDAGSQTPDSGMESGAEPDAYAHCCPISAQPSCCMEYGGARITGACGMSCDGMPWPGPLWRIEQDEYGCPRWVEPPREPGECCGCVPPDAGS